MKQLVKKPCGKVVHIRSGDAEKSLCGTKSKARRSPKLRWWTVRDSSVDDICEPCLLKFFERALKK